MRLRTFTAPDMNRAMLMIRETMGDDAVIISTARDVTGKQVTVTAALDDEWEEEPAQEETEAWEEELEEEGLVLTNGYGRNEAQRTVEKPRERQAERPESRDNSYVRPPVMQREDIVQNRDLAATLLEIETILQFHSAPLELIEKIMRASRYIKFSKPRADNEVGDMLSELIGHLYRFEPLEMEENPSRIMLVGPPGVGKTISVAKIAASLVAERLPVHVMTIDNKRAGSIEQLRAFTSIMGRETELATSRSELRQLLKDCPADEPVVIDSFATNPYSYEELKELTDYATLNGIEPLLVLPAGIDAHEAADTARAFAFLGIRRLLVTRIDTARRMGAILSAAETADLALANMSVNSQVAAGFVPFTPEGFSAILMQRKND